MNPPNRQNLHDFKRILDEEISLYQGIELQLERKKSIVIQGDLEALSVLDTQLEQLTLRAKELEKERLVQMVEMGREGNTLREFIESLETGEDSRILEGARSKLVASTQEIKRLSQENRDLLTQSIRFIEQSVEFIANILAPEGASYGNQAIRQKPAGNTLEETIGFPSTIVRDA